MGSPNISVRAQNICVPSVPFSPATQLLSPCLLLSFSHHFFHSPVSFLLPTCLSPTPPHSYASTRKGSKHPPPAAPTGAALSALVPTQELLSGAFPTGSNQEPTGRACSSLRNPVTSWWHPESAVVGAFTPQKSAAAPNRASRLLSYKRLVKHVPARHCFGHRGHLLPNRHFSRTCNNNNNPATDVGAQDSTFVSSTVSAVAGKQRQLKTQAGPVPTELTV